MALTHVGFSRGTPAGGRLDNLLNHLRAFMDSMPHELATMAKMVNGDGSLAAHFTYMTDKYGFDNDAAAKAAFDELNAAWAKVAGDTSQTNVNAALKQVVDRLA